MVESDSTPQVQGLDITMGGSSVNSEVVVMDERVLETAARVPTPAVHNLNVTKFSRVHIGTKIVTVTQNVDNTEVVKGRILGLELVSPKNSRRLRCSIAVFVCWALVVACALAFFIFRFALTKQAKRLDIDLPLPRYLWNIAKSTTRAERLSCAAAMAVLIICILLIVYFVVIASQANNIQEDVAPDEWYITREMWLAPNFNTTERMDDYEPIGIVIIAHTVSTQCVRFINCAAEMRNLQAWFERFEGHDLPYNFLIGNDGRVYEGRGWNVVGAHTVDYNHCSINIAFIGDYREGRPSYAQVTELQQKRAQMLMAQGVELGHLHPQYKVVGARDLKPTLSPGDNLYKAIQKWDHFAHDNIFKDLTCAEIRLIFQANSTTTETDFLYNTTVFDGYITTNSPSFETNSTTDAQTKE